MALRNSKIFVIVIGTLLLVTVYVLALAGFSRLEIFVLPLGDVQSRLFSVHVLVGILVGVPSERRLARIVDRSRRRLAMLEIVLFTLGSFAIALGIRRFLALGDDAEVPDTFVRGARLGELLAAGSLQILMLALIWHGRATIERKIPRTVLALVSGLAIFAGVSEMMEGEIPVRPWQFVLVLLLVAVGFIWRAELAWQMPRSTGGRAGRLLLLSRVILVLVAFSTVGGWFAANVQELVYRRVLLPIWPDIVVRDGSFLLVREEMGDAGHGWLVLSAEHEVLGRLDSRPRSCFKSKTLFPRPQGAFQSRYVELGLGDRYLRQRSASGDLWLDLDIGLVRRWRLLGPDPKLVSEEFARSDGGSFSSLAEIQKVKASGESLIHDPLDSSIWYLGVDRRYHPLVVPHGDRIVSWGWRVDDRLRYQPFEDREVKDSVYTFLRGRIDNYLLKEGARLEVDGFGRPARLEARVLERDLLAPLVGIEDRAGNEVHHHRYGVHGLTEGLAAAPILAATLLRAPLLNIIAFAAGEGARPDRVHKAVVIDPLLVDRSRPWLLVLSLGLDILGFRFLRRRFRIRDFPDSQSRPWLVAALLGGPLVVVFALIAERRPTEPTSVPVAA